MKYQFKNPETGGTGEIEAAKVGEALARGMQPLQDLQFYNPETQGTGVVPAAKAAEAMQRGLLPVGSREHAVATTGKLESFGRSAAQSATFGFADEIAGALKSLFGDQSYPEARDEYRQNDDIAQQANPMTSLAGSLGGAVASSFIPGLGQIGAVQKGADLLDVAKAAGAAGALTGLGTSRADLTKGDVGGAVGDTIEGGALGAAGGAIIHGTKEGLYALGGAAKRGLGRYFDPTVNRLQAAGASMQNIKQAGGLEDLVSAVQHADTRGIWQGKTPTEMLGRVEAELDKDISGMYNLMGNAPVEKLPLDDVWINSLEPKFQELISKADPMERETANILKQKLGDELMDTGGDITKLWELKKTSGGWANWNKDSPVLNQMKKMFNQELNDLTVSATNEVAQRLGIDDLAKLNESYSHLIKLRDYLGQTVNKEAYQGGPSTMQMKDYVRGSAVGAGIGAMTGIPLVGGAAGIGAMAAGAVSRSTTGRLARAKVGDMLGLAAEGLQKQAASNAQAAAAGMMPRTLPGARQWIQQFANMIPPQFQQAAQNVMRLPDSAAEMEVRMLMPMIQQMMAPSPYQSEFNGKVSSPQDRIAATQVIKTQGLPPSVAAYHQSLLNKSGTLQPYHYAAQQGDYGDELLAYNERLTAMGY